MFIFATPRIVQLGEILVQELPAGDPGSDHGPTQPDQVNGHLSCSPSERAALDARRRLVEQVERGELDHTQETFAHPWTRWLERRRPYLEPNTGRA
jgi:hypothetical protein